MLWFYEYFSKKHARARHSNSKIKILNTPAYVLGKGLCQPDPLYKRAIFAYSVASWIKARRNLLMHPTPVVFYNGILLPYAKVARI